jgi:hypothetical protein
MVYFLNLISIGFFSNALFVLILKFCYYLNNSYILYLKGSVGMDNKKEKRSIQLSVQLDQSMFDFMEKKAKIENIKFQPAKELYALAKIGMTYISNENDIDIEYFTNLESYEKELKEREKAVEDMLLVITELKKIGKKIKLVDIDE